MMGRGGLSIFDVVTGTDRAIAMIASVYPGYGFSTDGHRVVFGKYSGGLFLATFDPQTMRAKSRQLPKPESATVSHGRQTTSGSSSAGD
jgi:hypothetical protein